MRQDIFEDIKNTAIEKVLDKYFSEGDPSRIAMRKLLEELLERIMVSEREIHLQKTGEDKGNGFYDRTLATSIGKLELFKHRELPEDAFALLIDAYQCDIRENSKVKKATCYVIL
jgi:hypothetical protein